MGKTIKLDYDEIQVSYTKLVNIQRETEESYLAIDRACFSAENSMKGRYGVAFKETRKIIFDDFKKSVKEIKDIAEKIEGATSDIYEREMSISKEIMDSLNVRNK